MLRGDQVFWLLLFLINGGIKLKLRCRLEVPRAHFFHWQNIIVIRGDFCEKIYRTFRFPFLRFRCQNIGVWRSRLEWANWLLRVPSIFRVNILNQINIRLLLSFIPLKKRLWFLCPHIFYLWKVFIHLINIYFHLWKVIQHNRVSRVIFLGRGLGVV